MAVTLKLVTLPVSPPARLVAVTLYLELAPSGIGRLPAACYQLAELLNMAPTDVGSAMAELQEIQWLRVDRAVHWIPSALAASHLNLANRNHRKSVARHLAKIEEVAPSGLVDELRAILTDAEKNGIPDTSETVGDTSESSPDRDTIGDQDRGVRIGEGGRREGGNRNREDGRPSVSSPVENPNSFRELAEWLGQTAVLSRASILWDGNTPDWPRMILDRYGPEGVEPQPRKVVLLALADLTRKTSGILSHKSLEAFVHETAKRQGRS